jgi:putative restriction endonuclease
MAEQHNWEQRAAQAWPVLCACAAEERVITYGELGRSIDLHHRAVRYVLGVIQDYCLGAQLPPLTILIVNQDTRRPGEGFIAWDADDIKAGMEKVYGYTNWHVLPNPFAYAVGGLSERVLSEALLAEPDRSEDVYSLVRDRGIVQSIFRRVLLLAYAGECAFCGLSFEQALEGAHIIRWASASEAQRLDARNGLLLCATHHRLFDSNVLSVDTAGRIRFIWDGAGQLSAVDEAVSAALDGSLLRAPTRDDLRPSEEALHWRQQHA